MAAREMISDRALSILDPVRRPLSSKPNHSQVLRVDLIQNSAMNEGKEISDNNQLIMPIVIQPSNGPTDTMHANQQASSVTAEAGQLGSSQPYQFVGNAPPLTLAQ